jgi:hypothetical protein
MMSIPRYTKKHLLLAAMVGAAISYGALRFGLDGTAQREPVAAHEQNAQALDKEQEQKEQPLTPPTEAATKPVDIEQIRKDLSTRFIGDPRTFGEKLRDFVAENTHSHTIAIACKVVADLAENPDTLTNEELVSLYDNQTNKEFKRVLAQVLSLRGSNSLMEKLVAEATTALKSNNPAERRKVLLELAKTHYAGAANVIAPLVQDSDTSVKLDALLALRATGNESHIRHIENLINHPDQSVSWLANDAISQLQNLSTKARTKLTAADIAAELPLIPAY